MNRVLLPFPEQRKLATDLGSRLQARVGKLDWHRFPDGESLVTLDTDLGDADVALVASLNAPDAIALPLRFAAETVRSMGARSIGLVAPYLAYLRQDQRFHAGEALSARLFAEFLEGSFDWLVTVDPHLHRIASLTELFTIPTSHVATAPLVASWVRTSVPDAVLLGPDAESAQWVSQVAQDAGLPWQALTKHRHGDESVDVVSPAQPLPETCTPVIVDDIASTGRTLEAALSQLPGRQRARAVCVVTHAVFAPLAYERLCEGGVRIVSTDTIPHASNAIWVAPALAGAMATHFEREDAARKTDDADAWFDGQASG
jgi:ribose-phosphate pyrophosphokinase